uniref:WC-rich domain-containing protein n=1 Tax=Haemonchus placei TaxID=6290 RepID=A0A158QMY4_HAEPC
LSRMHFAAGNWRIWRPLFQFKIGYLVASLGIPSLCLMSIPVVYFLMASKRKTWSEALHVVAPHIMFTYIFPGYLVASLGIPSLCLMSIPVVYFLMASKRKTWSEALHVVAPHIVCIAWSDVAMTLLMIGWKSFGFLDLILTSCVVSLLFFPTLAAAVVVLSVVAMQIKSAIDIVSWAKVAITLIVLVSPFIVSKLYNFLSNRYKFSIAPSSPEQRKWIMLGIYFTSLLMAISFLYEGQMSFDPAADYTNMTWFVYPVNLIESFLGTAINWKGTVQSVRVVNIDNSFETLLGYLPESIGQTLRCFYDSNRTTADAEGMRPNECSLTEHNVYTFEIDVSGPYGERMVSSAKGQLVLSASHVFYEMLQLVDEVVVSKLEAERQQITILKP